MCGTLYITIALLLFSRNANCYITREPKDGCLRHLLCRIISEQWVERFVQSPSLLGAERTFHVQFVLIRGSQRKENSQ